ncbi:peptide deformylase [Caminibacter mediatlanticus TB-2]|uniref:Peptide deformylase n=1 Tax=Caminibacter mediatlanticus TB-2 TaxID=391592 RepID=A0AAI9F1D2_9BACT|nr:peptide deformylase [Caminibacter mediatlanticus]EDM23582.1 peptide deformylase [Caminibacter mediatlanticus TB-2]QCT93881.1 peptide deformylase [Caminibacter mediatlanticus TB-2]
MAILDIVTYPNKILKQISKPVERFDSELHKLLDDMYETMIAKNGIGLAAIQVGVPIRALLIDLGDEEGKQSKDTLIEVINPEFLEWDGSLKYNEGCLSVPDYFDEVERYKKVKVKFFDRFGKEHIVDAEDLLSVAFQHETDHLDGHVFIERLDYIKRKKFEKEWKKLLKKRKK